MTIDTFKLLTQRLELRIHRLEDADFMLDLNSDKEVTRHVPDGAFENAQQAEEIIRSLRVQFTERQIGRFIVIEKQSGRRIGWCGLKCLEAGNEIDLGYRILRSVWGQGFASEAAKACLEYGFNTLGFERITARIAPANLGSIAVAKKLGMNKIGRVVEGGVEYLVFEIRRTIFLTR